MKNFTPSFLGRFGPVPLYFRRNISTSVIQFSLTIAAVLSTTFYAQAQTCSCKEFHYVNDDNCHVDRVESITAVACNSPFNPCDTL